MWRELIQNLASEYEFNPPASGKDITATEHSLGVLLPSELRELLEETDGITGEYGLDLIWDINRIKQDNLQFREMPDFKSLYMPFDHLLFFADAGNGDQFAFVVLDGVVRNRDIFVWNHEDDSRIWVAPSLEKYLEWWLNGRLKI